MAEFQVPVDIANRGLQHCGVRLMDAVAGFSENTTASRAVSSCYGKLRRAELQRNAWVFSTRRAALRAIDTNTLLLAPALWVAGTTYFAGSIVSDAANNLWQSLVPNNLGSPPISASGTTSSAYWAPYFGPTAVSLYDPTQTYFSGEVVYTAPGDGTYRVYLSLISANADNPATATAWSATGTYGKNQVATFASVAYMSLIALNINQEPDLAPALWAIGTTYAAGTKAGGSDGVIYQSVGSGNIGHDPTTPGSTFWTSTGVLNPWTTVLTGGKGSLNWLEIGGAEFPNGVGLVALNIVYPLGAGPSSQSSTRNVYRLPNGFLREVSQNPKAGAISYLGAPGADVYNDWVLEGGYLITGCTGVIVFRFGADVTDVSQMDDMFCEGLAARVGLEVCEPLTQSSEKLATIQRIYADHIGQARTVNAIEVGSEEAPLDDYLACRA